MKTLLKILPVSLILFSFSNCASGKRVQQEAPAEVEQAFYSTWTGGVKGADSGMAVFIPVQKDKELVLDTVFFRGMKAPLEKEVTEPNLYVGYFKIPSPVDRDLVMHSDPRKEFGNKPPVILEDIPFELEPDEAVVQYTKDGKEKFFKIKVTKKAESEPILRKKPENIRH